MTNVVYSLNHSPYGPRGWQAVFRPVLILLFCLGTFIILPAFLLPRFGIRLEMRGRTLVGLGGTLAAELVLFGFLMRWLKGQGRSLKDIGWGRRTTASAIILGIAFALVYALYTLSNPLIGANAAEISLFKLVGVVVGIVGGSRRRMCLSRLPDDGIGKRERANRRPNPGFGGLIWPHPC